MNFTKRETCIEGLFTIEPKAFSDNRGYFFESYKASDFIELGINDNIVQSNQSRSSKGVIRGLHFQSGEFAQGKLVRCLSGRIYDVAVDIRKDSKTYGKHFGIELSDENKLMFYIPKGFAHGFSVLSKSADVFYDVFGGQYNKESEGGIRFDDPDLGIDWQIGESILSDKDKELDFFKDFKNSF